MGEAHPNHHHLANKKANNLRKWWCQCSRGWFSWTLIVLQTSCRVWTHLPNANPPNMVITIGFKPKWKNPPHPMDRMIN
jgi:hypothetical protein